MKCVSTVGSWCRILAVPMSMRLEIVAHSPAFQSKALNPEYRGDRPQTPFSAVVGIAAVIAAGEIRRAFTLADLLLCIRDVARTH